MFSASGCFLHRVKFQILNSRQFRKIQDGYHPMLSIRINGKKAMVVLDTGASKTVFDHTQIQQYLAGRDPKEHHSLSTGLGTNTMKSMVYKPEMLCRVLVRLTTAPAQTPLRCFASSVNWS